MRVLFSNIGYARDIDGSLKKYIRYAHHHLYAPPGVQKRVLSQIRDLITVQRPDLCCLVEVDSGSFHSARLNQLQALIDDEYLYHDIACKYGPGNPLGRLPLHKGKSHAFLAREPFSHQKLYFQSGSKRLIYRFDLPGNIHLFFSHFSLSRRTRLRQFAELQVLLQSVEGEVCILADFNIFHGFDELQYFLRDTGLRVMNEPAVPTFAFHTRSHVFDLCLCSPGLAERLRLEVIPQPFSDHEALLATWEG